MEYNFTAESLDPQTFVASMNDSAADSSAVQETSSNDESDEWNDDQPQTSNTADLTTFIGDGDTDAPTFGFAPATASSSDAFPMLSSAPFNSSHATNTITTSTSIMIDPITLLPTVISTSTLLSSMAASPYISTPLPRPFPSVNSQHYSEASPPIDLNLQVNPAMQQQPGVIIGITCFLLGISCVIFGLTYTVVQRQRRVRKALRKQRVASGFDFNGGSEGDYDGGYEVWHKVSAPNTPAHFGPAQPICIKHEKADTWYDGPPTLMNDIKRLSAITTYSATDEENSDKNNNNLHYYHRQHQNHDDDGPIHQLHSAPSIPPSAYGSYNDKGIAM